MCESWVCGSTPVMFVHPPGAPPLPSLCVCFPAHLCPPCSPLDIALCRRTRTLRVTIQRRRGRASAWLMPSPRSTPSPQSTPRDRRPLQQQMARSSRPSASSSRQRRRRPGSRGGSSSSSQRRFTCGTCSCNDSCAVPCLLSACLLVFVQFTIIETPMAVCRVPERGGTAALCGRHPGACPPAGRFQPAAQLVGHSAGGVPHALT